MADRDTEGQRTLIVRKITRQWNEKEKAYICIPFAKSDLLSQSRVKHTLVNSLRRFLNPEIEHAYHKFSLLCFSLFLEKILDTDFKLTPSYEAPAVYTSINFKITHFTMWRFYPYYHEAESHFLAVYTTLSRGQPQNKTMKAYQQLLQLYKELTVYNPCFIYVSFILFIVPCKNDLRREFQTSKFFEKGADLVTFEG